MPAPSTWTSPVLSFLRTCVLFWHAAISFFLGLPMSYFGNCVQLKEKTAIRFDVFFEISWNSCNQDCLTPLTPRLIDSFLQEILMSYIWTVTGWHRHVGTVGPLAQLNWLCFPSLWIVVDHQIYQILWGDYYRDPELASFSWREGERVARPLQHMQMLACSTTVAWTQHDTTVWCFLGPKNS